jgi:multiple antibiotic resistance protein
LVYAGLFPVVNPLGGAPLFLSLTTGCTEQQRNRLAWQVAFNGFCSARCCWDRRSLSSSASASRWCALPAASWSPRWGWNLLNGNDGAGDHQTVGPDAGPPQSFYPLTLPLTVGPGSIAVAVTFGSHRPEGSMVLPLIGAAIAGLFAISVTIFVCYRFAQQLARVLGESGINVMIRLSAFILICIGIQICWGGVSALIATLPR